MPSGVASYGALGYVPLLKFWKRISLTVKISKSTKKSFIHLSILETYKHVLHFRLSRQKHAKSHANRFKQSQKIPGIRGRGKIHVVLPLASFPAATPLLGNSYNCRHMPSFWGKTKKIC